MFTRNIKDTFTQGLLNAVSGVLGEAKKKCSEECECEACMKEGYMPTNDAPSDKDRKTAGKLGALLKREREAKEKKEPNGVKTEETEVDENYVSHAQRKAVWANRADDGKGHPDKKKKMKESNDDVPFEGPYDKPGVRKDKYGNIIKNVAKHLAKKAMNTQKNEEVEQIDELSTKTLEKYRNIARNDAYDADEVDDEPRFRKRAKGITQANKAIRKNFVKGVNEEEQIDELSKGTMGRYINKAADRMSTQGVTAGLKIAADEKSKKNFDNIAKRQKGIATAVKKLTKEEQDFIDSLNDADAEQIDELSDATLKSYSKKALDQSKTLTGDQKVKRQVGARNAIDRLGNNTLAKEEVELDEARGRPRKAGAKDFTIHPKTKEKLMHNNPEHMKKIEALQRNGVIPVPKVEAGQHIMNQLSKAKTSMLGGSKIHFTHGDSKEVSGTHAAKILTKYAGLKPSEKEDFQKFVGHSHENLMKHV